MVNSRAQQAFDTRVKAAQLAFDRPIEASVANGDEQTVNQLIASFTKGMRHNDNGEIAKKADFFAFVSAANSGDVDEIAGLNLGPGTDDDGNPIWRSDLARNLPTTNRPAKVRGWESMAAGLTFDLEGPDAQSVAMPPVPKLSSQELISEMAEVYLMALGRDIPISKWNTSEAQSDFFEFAIEQLNKLEWFCKPASPSDSEPERRRRRGLVTMDNIFRGILPGTQNGPFLSQFLISGSQQIGDLNAGDQSRGLIAYGSITIDQRVRIATSGKDYMTNFDIFRDVQDAADLRGLETYDQGKRLITNMRDLSTWVHFDALYEAYLNALLIMLANRYPFDSGLPFQEDDSIDKQTPFVNFGGPHILSLVTEVATRALKAVRFQKFNVHRRTRPEAIGGLINAKLNRRAEDTSSSGSDHDDNDDREDLFPEINEMVDELDEILKRVKTHNEVNNKMAGDSSPDPSYLLPMAFTEGSPMHPAYGSGHATVAGACVTILKAFFEESTVIKNVYEVDPDTDSLVESSFQGTLTVGEELNKLADNISVGRNMAGVHYFTDAFESLLLGEKIAIGILEEQKLTFGEEFSFSLTKFNGDTITI